MFIQVSEVSCRFLEVSRGSGKSLGALSEVSCRSLEVPEWCFYRPLGIPFVGSCRSLSLLVGLSQFLRVPVG